MICAIYITSLGGKGFENIYELGSNKGDTAILLEEANH